MTRIAPIPPEQLADYAEGFAAVEAFMGFVPSSLSVMARVPGLLDGFTRLTATVFLNDLLPIDLKQLIGSMASAGAGCRYCQAHTAAHAEHLGVAGEKLAELWSFETSDRFDDAERAALRLAFHSGQHPNAVTDADIDACRAHWTDEQIVAIVAVCAVFGYLNRWNDTMATTLEAVPRGVGGAAPRAAGLGDRQARMSEHPDTVVTLTGTGVPLPAPGRAGPGTLVRYGDVALQFDAGRGTVLRLAEAVQPPSRLSALFLTHVHIDHVSDVADLAMTRWIFDPLDPVEILPVVAPEGPSADFARHLFEAYAGDIEARTAELLSGPPAIVLSAFPVRPEPIEVWRHGDGAVVVEAVGVHHEPCHGAVAYRVTTPTGVVVVSGDTRVCDEVESLAAGADIVVHEACRSASMRPALARAGYAQALDYHADTVALGAMAQRARTPRLVLTHLIPPPASAADETAFADDVRRGGYTGELTVGRDLCSVVARPSAVTPSGAPAPRSTGGGAVVGTLDGMSAVDDVARAVALVRDHVRGLDDADLARTTPCAGWTVRDVVCHVAGVYAGTAAALHGARVDLVAATVDLGDDAEQAVAVAADAMLAAWREPGALDRTLATTIRDMPAALAVRIVVGDSLLHGWDLARVLDRPIAMPDDLAEAQLAMMQQYYDPAAAGPAGASILPWSGRTPRRCRNASSHSRVATRGGRRGLETWP